MGYRNEIYRVAPVVEEPQRSFCMPASMQDWKARGWRVFDGLDHPEYSATRPDPKDSSIIGLSYSLHSCHEGKAEKIMLRLDSWCYDKQGETTDLPVMELVFDAQRFAVPPRALESLKVMARPINLSEKVASRAVNAALFLINQINADQVPDFERILELHRIHPDLNKGAGMVAGKNNREADDPAPDHLVSAKTGLKGVAE